jgi:ATP-binding cassette subfamily F protein 3
VLATLVWRRPNLLLLDEPTNHLDLATREALSIALNSFEGTVLLVSHDRALLREVCDEFWLVTRGGVSPFDGDLDDYQRWLLEVSRATARGDAPPMPPSATRVASITPPPTPVSSRTSGTGGAAPPASSAPASPRTNGTDDRKARAQARQRLADLSRPLRVEVAQIDKRLEALTSERQTVEQALTTASLSPADIADHGRRLNHIAAETTMLEERWLELNAQLDTLQAATG